MLLRMAADAAVWFGLLLVIVAPIDLVAGRSDFAFNPSSVNLVAVIGTETANQVVQVTNVSGKAIKISSITIELNSTAFSETDNCHAEIAAGASCAMAVSFHPTNGGGRDHIQKAILIFNVAGTEAAYLDAQGQAI
jgi:hypothetical protein